LIAEKLGRIISWSNTGSQAVPHVGRGETKKGRGGENKCEFNYPQCLKVATYKIENSLIFDISEDTVKIHIHVKKTFPAKREDQNTVAGRHP
jgi:hypothetical protein